MKLLLFVLAMSISISTRAGCEDGPHEYVKGPDDITIEFYDTPVSAVVEHINAQCEGRMDPITTSRPDDLISLNFEIIHCEAAAAVIEDFDSSAREKS